MAAKEQYIIGVDTGGTFHRRRRAGNDGEVWTAKASTTPDDFSRGVMDAVNEAASAAGVDTPESAGPDHTLQTWQHGRHQRADHPQRLQGRPHYHQGIRRHHRDHARHRPRRRSIRRRDQACHLDHQAGAIRGSASVSSACASAWTTRGTKSCRSIGVM